MDFEVCFDGQTLIVLSIYRCIVTAEKAWKFQWIGYSFYRVFNYWQVLWKDADSYILFHEGALYPQHLNFHYFLCMCMILALDIIYSAKSKWSTLKEYLKNRTVSSWPSVGRPWLNTRGRSTALAAKRYEHWRSLGFFGCQNLWT